VALAWLEREQVFKWLPFVPVQALLVFLLLPFVLLVYLSLVSWRITRGVWWHAPFVGAANFTVAVRDERFVWAVIRTFGFAAAAVPSSSASASGSPCSAASGSVGAASTRRSSCYR